MSTNPYWLQAAWFIDPQNLSGLASNGNTGLTLATPLQSYSEVLARWGTPAPRVPQSTTITFMSSHTDGSDPVICNPYLLAGAHFVIQADVIDAGPRANLLGSGALAAVTPLSFGAGINAGTFLHGATPGNVGAAGDLVINTTRGNSAACIYQVGADRVFCQPINPVAIPFNTFPTQNAAWVTGDNVKIYHLRSVNLVQYQPVLCEFDGSVDLPAYTTNLSIFDPAGPLFGDPFSFNLCVSFLNCRSDRFAIEDPSTPPGILNVLINMMWAAGGLFNNCGFATQFQGGALTGFPYEFGPGQYNVQQNTIIDQATGFGSGGDVSFIDVACDGAITIVMETCHFQQTGTLWGRTGSTAALNAIGTTRWEATGTAVSTIKVTPKLNGATTAVAFNSGVNPGTWPTGIALTPSNLDLAIGGGGFGGKAIIPGGSSVVVSGGT